MKNDARVDTEHPLLRFLRLPMRLPHIRLFRNDCFVGRDNQ